MSSASATVVPCLYRTGRTIGSGTYAIVKEAVHVKTGEHYACKVINKKLMEGREFLIHNEVQVLKRISIGHKNIVALRDYFETEWNLYLCFDLCTGGELFDRICAKGNYYEADAANIVRSVVSALEYIHAAGIVHRDLKPENLLFRTDAEDAEVMIADFGLSRILDEGKMDKLTEVCGTPAYMAPEVFRKTGHGQPVDIWAVGVITYFLLAGYTPFDRRTTKEEIRAIKAGDYEFKPEKYWRHVSETGKAFVQICLTMDPRERPEASEVLGHEWLAKQDADNTPQEELDRQLSERHDLLPFMKEGSLLRKASAGTGLSPPSPLSRPATPLSPSDEAERQGIRDNVKECQEQSRKEDTETTVVIRQVTEDDEDGKAGNEDDDGDEEEGREDTNEEEDSEEDKRGRSRRERLRDRGQDVLVGALSKLKIKKLWIRLQRFNAHVHLSR